MLSKSSGIYCFENTVNGRKYIGKANNIYVRVRNHIACLNNNSDKSTYLQNAWNRYGKESFSIYVLEECFREELIEKEKEYIALLNTKRPFGYNLTDGGEGLSGYKQSEENKRKLSALRSGKKLSEKTRKNISLGHLGL
jgi:group I intron endonuclease